MIDLVPEIRFSGTWHESAKNWSLNKTILYFLKLCSTFGHVEKNMPRLWQKMKKSLSKIHFFMAIPMPETHIIFILHYIYFAMALF